MVKLSQYLTINDFEGWEISGPQFGETKDMATMPECVECNDKTGETYHGFLNRLSASPHVCRWIYSVDMLFSDSSQTAPSLEVLLWCQGLFCVLPVHQLSHSNHTHALAAERLKNSVKVTILERSERWLFTKHRRHVMCPPHVIFRFACTK